MNTRKLSIFTLAAAVTWATAASADGHLTQDQQRAMDARQAHMSLYAFNLGAVGAMVQDRTPYDAQVAAAAATNIAALASISQDRYWVDGTDSSIEGSRAKPEIWSDMDGYMAKNAAFAEAANNLAAVAGDGLDAMKAAFGPVGQGCGSCHESYRVPNN